MTSLREERINPILIWGAAAASLLIHALLIFGLRKIPIVSPGALLIEPPERRVALRFIDSPERIEPVEEVPLTDLVSDRDSLAQDMVPDRVEVDESPRAVGIARERSVRKEPGGEPQPIQPPGREAETAPERLTGVGSRDDQVVPRKQSPAKPATESPIVARGEDKFYSPEEDSPEGRARILKQISYNMRSNEVGKYLSRLKPRVVNLWHFNVMQSTFYVRSGLTHVLFKILPDGSVGKVMVNKHDGPDLEMRYGLNAIKMAQPYEPLSPEVLDYIKDDGLWLEFRFQYR
jgi:hypothetical protein